METSSRNSNEATAGEVEVKAGKVDLVLQHEHEVLSRPVAMQKAARSLADSCGW